MSFRLYAVFGVLCAALFVTQKAAAVDGCACDCAEGIKVNVCDPAFFGTTGVPARMESQAVAECAASSLVCTVTEPDPIPPPVAPIAGVPPEGASNCRRIHFRALGTRVVCSVAERHDARREQWAAKRVAHKARWDAKQAQRAARHARHPHSAKRVAREKARWDKRVARWNARRDKREARWKAKEHKWATKDS